MTWKYREIFNASQWSSTEFFKREILYMVPFIFGAAPLYHGESRLTGRYAGRRAYCFFIALLVDFVTVYPKVHEITLELYEKGISWQIFLLGAFGFPIVMTVVSVFSFYFIGWLLSLPSVALTELFMMIFDQEEIDGV